MKLSELLDHLAVHVLDDRANLLAGLPDELWSDEALVRWLNEAQRILCSEAWVIEDVANATCGTIQLVEGQKDYALHASVLRVLSGHLSDTEVDLVHVAYDLSRPQSNLVPSDFFYPADTVTSDAPGRPGVFATDVATQTLRVRTKPDAAAAALQLLLRTSHMPVVELTVASPDASPEVPPKYHMGLIDFAAAEALSVPAADAALRSVAKDYRDKWETRVSKARKARQRAEMAPVQWQFGNNGRNG